ncbi:hypothetical protein [Archangium sp.]|uniref:hypothetical protein n=1 Tax=Archangium sp. TaxID=1872627 RepID=UPI00286A99D0|nr:hypothetical protein [Archangium sp.]
MDPVLASVYARMGHARFATELVGIGWILDRSDEHVHGLEEINKRWRDERWQDLGEPVIVFGGDIYAYATVPQLADERGRQPVVEVNTYEIDGLYVMPVASDVDRFFDSYSRYLEVLIADPDYQRNGEANLLFPWNATDILARDERLVELMRARRFDSLMKSSMTSEDVRRWFEKVCGLSL